MKSNFALFPAEQCGGTAATHPQVAYNSMNSDFGGDLIKARFGHGPEALGSHVIGILLAGDDHQPVLVDGKPVTALVTVTTK